ncbi:MAG TPA: amidase family protein [Solirubrobacterales bacterium]|nr:amidase family protein [Solirubrobacterales bacterium]
MDDLLVIQQNGAASPREVLIEALERCRRAGDLNAFITLADDSETASPGSREGLPLAGIPIAVKDCIDVAGFPCTAGTPGLRDWRPRHDAPIVARLRAAGAVFAGKTNLHELTLGASSDNPTFGRVRNPHAPELIAGGSSGGSAVAVAIGAVPVALGTDTVGSSRVPAALCGCVGFRPTTGRYPHGGIVQGSLTLDTPGLFAGNVPDLLLVDHILSGEGGGESEIAGKRVGVPRRYFYDDLDPELEVTIEAALQRLAGAGAELIETEIGGLDEKLAQLSPIASFELPRELAFYLAAGRAPFTAWAVIDAIAGDFERAHYEEQLWGQAISERQYGEALGGGRKALVDAYAACFEGDRLDVLAFPATPLPARPLGDDETVCLNGRAVNAHDTYLRNTAPASFAAIPSISVPAGETAAGLPVGICFEMPRGRDRALLGLAAAFERLGSA